VPLRVLDGSCYGLVWRRSRSVHCAHNDMYSTTAAGRGRAAPHAPGGQEGQGANGTLGRTAPPSRA